MIGATVVEVDAGRIVDWASFHDTFAEAFRFPDWYGRNLDAWTDLLTRMDENPAATGVRVGGGETVTILLRGGPDLRRRVPTLYDAIVECSAFVNWRRIEAGRHPYLCLAFA